MKCRAYLLHLQEYDQKTAESCIEAVATASFNALIISIKDAVIYKSLPHIKKPYSVPMQKLVALTNLARSLGLEVIPKLNFSKSNVHRHSEWLWKEQRPKDSAHLWKDALKAIDEIIIATKPRYFHVGMDEDDTRSPDEYAKALKFLHSALKKRKLRMIIWADCGHNWRQTERWKEVPAILNLPRDVILMPWHYEMTLVDWVRKYQRMGFDVIGTSASLPVKRKNNTWDVKWDGKNTCEWLKILKKNKSFGICVTRWTSTSSKNRSMLLEGIRESGKHFLEEGINLKEPFDK